MFRTDELPWREFSNAADLPEEMRNGVRRQQLAEGESGFFAHVADMAPGYRVAPHSHSHSEFLIVLAGSCELDDGTRLTAGDAAVFAANVTYGFRCLDDGFRFCVVRADKAEMKIER